MYYAVKEVDGKEVNKIFDNWDICRIVVWGKNNALYKGFDERDAAEKFIQSSLSIKPKKALPRDLQATELTVSFNKLRYKNNNGYTIALYKTQDGETVTCTGNSLPTNAKLTYILRGKYVESKYGYNFEVQEVENAVNDDADSIINFLSSGFIKGIGKKKATDIYNRFKGKTLDILENDTERLLEVPGISQRTYEKIKESYLESKGARAIAEFLLSYGLPTTNAIRLYKIYGVTAIEKIKENPYILCFYRGITFEDVDIIAEDNGIELDSKLRAAFCANYILHLHERCGDTAMPLQEFGLEMYKRLNRVTTTEDIKDSVITKAWVNDMSKCLVKEGTLKYKIIDGNRLIVSNSSYYRDSSIAADLLRLNSYSQHLSEEEIERIISLAQRNLQVELDDSQKTAVKMALIHSVSIIYGRPGTGKTTTINVINEAFKLIDDEKERIFLAPTGRASQVLKEATGEETHTIHSFFHLRSDEVMIDYLDEEPIENARIIIDESSMIDAAVAQIMFSRIGKGCSVILLGDQNQIESVGAGAFFRDIIESDVLTKTKLKRIYRQDENSQIYKNIEKIEAGNTNLLDGDDFSFIECETMEDISKKMTNAYISAVKTVGLTNVMCLCPYRDYTAGFNEMNSLLQEKLNPLRSDVKETIINGTKIRTNDLVMHIRTNNEYCNNGDIGIVKDIIDDGDSKCIIVDINDMQVEYEGEDLQNLTLAYAMSVHKAQGSQAKVTITCIADFHSNMLIRNIPYVAISRGKKKVFVFGQKSALNTAIKNDRKRRRNTTLAYQLKEQNSNWIAVK